jgi:hypothetical protein
VFASFKAGKKAEAEDIPAATQIFTPNWIVKYMVQNTLGRIYLDNNPFDTDMKEKMQYLVEPSEPTPEEAKFKYDSLEDLRLGDLASGSGHILNEFFDLMYLFYIEDGYSRRNAIENIFMKNLTGIDLDTRAKQLAQFALLVKACQKDPSFLDATVMPNVLDMPAPLDTNFVKATLPEFFLGVNANMLQETEEAFELLQQAENLGSIMKFNISDSTRAAIEIRMKEWETQPAETVSDGIKALLHSFRLILALTQKYSALVMNPPYMGAGHMTSFLLEYSKENYPLTSNDLGAIFMEIAQSLVNSKGKFGIINMAAWILKPAYIKYREKIIALYDYNLESLLYLGPNTFPELKGEVVQSVSFIVSKTNKNLTKFYHLKQYANSHAKRDAFIEKRCKVFELSLLDFLNFKGRQFGFWINENIQAKFKTSPISNYGDAKQGLKTGDNNYFIKLWYEISYSKWNKKWFPVENGGNFRKWYGNGISVLNWENDGYEIKNLKDDKGKLRSRPQGLQYSFKNGITWSTSAADNPSFRFSSDIYMFESSGSKFFLNEESDLSPYLAYFNSNVVKSFIEMLSPGLGISEGAIKSLPFILPPDNISKKARENTKISKLDWDAHETSWDFQRNELLCMDTEAMLANIDWYCDLVYKETGKQLCIDPAAPEPEKISWCYDTYTKKWERLHRQLQENEISLNEKFIEIYGLQSELTPDVPANVITILQQGEVSYIPKPDGDDYSIQWNKDEVIRQLISYAIGCWMGRYRLDKPGLYIAHPDAKPEEIVTYEYNGQTFEIDDDGIIPLLPAYASFPDNGYKRIQDFVRIAFGTETLTENINFIEEALGMSLEKFMVKDFWKYHKKMYQNRPIYWLFSSKKGAFQCLAYMHRMNAYTVEQIRSKYLLPHIEWLKNHIAEMESRASQLSTQERRLKDQMAKDLKECLEYHDELHVVADHNISFDLDDGVVKNYALFGNVLARLR